MTILLDLICGQLGVQVVSRLMQGGQKQVFVVSDSNGDETVLKVIDLGIVPDPTAIERARREVTLLKSIDHPNVVKVNSELLTIDNPSPCIFWLEELLVGRDLRFVRDNWDAGRLVSLGREVAAGLSALHLRGVVHRDLSPGNVQCLDSGGFVLMDPGFAKHTLRSGLTVGGQPGTPGFMTPEHVMSYSGAPTAASDVFGCAALVYYAATGVPAVQHNGDDMDYLHRLRTASHVPLADLRPDLPEQLLQIVDRALHPHPARRYRNGTELSRAFEDIA